MIGSKYDIVSVINPDVLGYMCRMLETTPKDGCIVEVGVFHGGSLGWLVTNAEGRPVYAYDTFEGMPYADPELDAHRVADFNGVDFDKLRAIFPGVHFSKGVFPASILEMPPVAFAHLDCDQYRSVREAIQALKPMMLPGGVIWFDDPNCLIGAKKAMEDEFHVSMIQQDAVSLKYYVRF